MWRLVIPLFALFNLHCQMMAAQGPSPGDRPLGTALSQQVETLARQADGTVRKDEQARLAAEAMAIGDTCVRHHPRNAACYYYRAMATGLYYEVKVIGYQTGVKQMLADCRKVIQLDPALDHAGAFRILGQLYTQLPKTTIHPGDITQDLDLARHYLSQAVVRAPADPENQRALCAALIALGETRETACQAK